MPHCGTKECEEELKEKTQGITSRCIPLTENGGLGTVKDKLETVNNKIGTMDSEQNAESSKPMTCVHCGKEAKQKIYFSRSY